MIEKKNEIHLHMSRKAGRIYRDEKETQRK